ncbi:MAG: hypothetical protein ACREIR_18840 [Geminicoccaceae bacterium]
MAAPERRDAGRLLVVGRNSFIARHFLATCPEAALAVEHDAIDRPDLLDGIDRIVSFARHPLLGSEDDRPGTVDPDLRLARRIAGREIDYVMLSPRKVYAPSPRPLAESAPTAPQVRYGRHKLAAEQALGERLGTGATGHLVPTRSCVAAASSSGAAWRAKPARAFRVLGWP